MREGLWATVVVLSTLGGALAGVHMVWSQARRRRTSDRPRPGRRFQGDVVVDVVREDAGARSAYVARGRWRDPAGRRHRRAFAKAFSLDSVLGHDARERLHAEAKALAAIESPFVAARLRREASPPGLEPTTWAVVHQAYLPGPSLSTFRASGPSVLAPGDQLAIFLALAEALRAAHSAGVVHRDVKPANVVVTREGPVLTDLGSAKLRDEQGRTLSGSGREPVSMEFGAPEQMWATPTSSEASDVFSLGLLMLYSLVGEPVRPAPSAPLGAAGPAAVELGIDGLLVRCLEPLPSARITAAGLVDALVTIAAQRVHAQVPHTAKDLVASLWSARPPRPRLRRPLADIFVPALAVFALVALAAALVAGPRSDDTASAEPAETLAVPTSAGTATSAPPRSSVPSTTTTTTAQTATSLRPSTTTPDSTAPVTVPEGDAPPEAVQEQATVTLPTHYCDGEPMASGTSVGAADSGLLEWNDVWDGSPSDMPYDVYVVDFDCDATPVGRMNPGDTIRVDALTGQMIEWRYTRDGVGQGSESIEAGGWAGTLHLTNGDDRAWVPYGCC